MINKTLHFIILLAILSLIPACSNQEEKTSINIAVASNFAQTAKKLITKFKENSTLEIILIKGSTGKHYTQIIHGAPYDIFFSADSATPKKLEQEKKIISKNRFTYAIGKIVLWSPKKNLMGFSKKSINKLKYRRFAIANSKLAPYGKAAEQSLRDLSLWAEVKKHLVFGENINQTFQFIKTGNADIGIISYSQYLLLKKEEQGSVWLIPQKHYQPINQQVVSLTKGDAVKKFISFLKSDVAKNIIKNAGYEVENE